VPNIKGNFIRGLTAGEEKTRYDKDYNPDLGGKR